MAEDKDRKQSTRERSDSSADPLSVTSLIGQGIYQKTLIIFLCAFIAPFMAANNIPQYLILLEPEYECAAPDPSYVGRPFIPAPSIFEHGGNRTLTVVQHYAARPVGDGTINPLSLFLELKRECFLRNDPTVPCPNGYKYKTDFIYHTIVSKYDWVCDNASPKFIAHSLYWLGSIFGVLVIGQVSDKLGRIPAIILCHLIAGAAGTLTPFSEQRIPLFMFLRFLLGFVIMSQGSVVYVLVMELIRSDQRSMVSNLYLLCYAVAAALLPWFAYFLHDWEMLSVLTSVPFLVIPFVVFFIPESIKWLVANNRIEEAKLSIKRIAKINDTPINEETLKNVDLRRGLIDTSESISDIFKYKRFFKIFVVSNILFFCQNVVYTGAVAFIAISTDNPYMMLTISNLVDVLSAVAGNYASEILGRKRATIIPCIIAGALYPISGFFDQDAQVLIFLFFMMTGRLFTTIGFNVQYLYAAEIYPTNIRARAYAIRMAIGSLGGLMAPQVVALGSIHGAAPLIVFGIVSVLSAFFMIFLPESKGCELPKSLIDGELIGLEDEEREKVASKYQVEKNGNVAEKGLNFNEWKEKEFDNVNEIILNQVQLKASIGDEK